MTSLRRIGTIGFVLAMFAGGTPASAQVSSTTGAINGTVTDNTKALVPGVTVAASGPSMVTRTVVTDAGGNYRIPLVPPGDYTLRFEMAGFRTVTREGIHVGVGFTATINEEMSPASVTETVTVSGASPVVDVVAAKVAVNYDAERLANVLGARDYFGTLPLMPGISVSNVDVGGSGALSVQGYKAYGLPGLGRGEIEGIVSNPVTGQETQYPDMQSFEEMAVNVAGNSAEMPLPGILSVFTSKSGSNNFHGSMYADYQPRSLEAHNIDAAQLALGVTGSATIPAQDTNRMIKFHNLNVDAGGFVVKDKLWWYGAYKNERLVQGSVSLVDAFNTSTANIYSGKLTYNLSSNSKVVAYATRTVKKVDNYMPGSSTTYGFGSIYSSEGTALQRLPVGVWKAEYNSVLSDRAVLEVRGGDWYYDFVANPKGEIQRYEDRTTGIIRGSTNFNDQVLHRHQVNGALSYFKNGWGGTHNFKIGGEVMNETSDVKWSSFNNLVLVLNNGQPSQVYFYQSPARSFSNNLIMAGYVNDTWRPSRRLTFNVGIRYDRYHPFTPSQTGPTGQAFSEFDGPTWNLPGPRVGVDYDLSGDGKTVVKANYGQYWQNPRTSFSDIFNPNPYKNFEGYNWTPANPTFVNGLPVFVPGQQGALVAKAGAQANGQPSTTIAPGLKNAYSRQLTAFLEREVAANFGVRTGFVWNGRRQGWGPLNINQPYNAFDQPTSVADPGPDGRPGTADDGQALQAFGLNPAYLGLPVITVVSNLPDVKNDYYTWELTGNRRQVGRWSLLASFSYTWNRESPFSLDSTSQVAYTPNALVNTVDGRNVFSTWATKMTGTVELPVGFRLTPALRFQSGVPAGRTFTGRLNYNSAVTMRTEPIDAAFTPKVTVLDARLEKNVALGARKFGLFFDVYNIFNENATLSVNTSSGASFLRPSAITAPRIARVGVKFSF